MRAFTRRDAEIFARSLMCCLVTLDQAAKSVSSGSVSTPAAGARSCFEIVNTQDDRKLFTEFGQQMGS